MECVLNNNKNSDFCAPLTSFDWNEVDPNLIGTSSIDTTCTIWGLETGQVLGRVNLVTGHVKTQVNTILPTIYRTIDSHSHEYVFPLHANVADSPRQGGLRHSVQPSRRRQGHVRIGGCRWVRAYVRSAASRALDDHLRGSTAHAAAEAGLEQAGSELPGNCGDGRLRGYHSGRQGALHTRCKAEQSQVSELSVID